MRKPRSHFRSLAAAALVCAAALARAETRATVRLRPEAVVEGRRVLLADLAEVGGRPPAFERRLRALDLGPAPHPLVPRRFSRSLVERSLRQAGIPPDAIAWAGAPQSRALALTALIPAAALVEAARRHLHRAWPWPEGELAVAVRVEPAALEVPGASQGIRLVAALASRRLPLGRVEARVTVARGRQALATARVPLDVRWRRLLVVAARPIAPGRLLEPDDVRLECVELDAPHADALADLAQALGRVARQAIPPGTVLTAAMLGPPRGSL